LGFPKWNLPCFHRSSTKNPWRQGQPPGLLIGAVWDMTTGCTPEKVSIITHYLAEWWVHQQTVWGKSSINGDIIYDIMGYLMIFMYVCMYVYIYTVLVYKI
jgi:hypothetical protein